MGVFDAIDISSLASLSHAMKKRGRQKWVKFCILCEKILYLRLAGLPKTPPFPGVDPKDTRFAWKFAKNIIGP